MLPHLSLSSSRRSLAHTFFSSNPWRGGTTPTVSCLDRNYCARCPELIARPFDIICKPVAQPPKLNPSLLNHDSNTNGAAEFMHLRPGMVLLKNFIKHQDQVKIIESCRKLGLGPGGFYTPYFRNGTRLHLELMCLGKNWDPDTRLYEDRRSIDGATPPRIPEEFTELVDGAFTISYQHLRKQKNKSGLYKQSSQIRFGTRAEQELPRISPDICIVNFYNQSGRLGLHQDKDERSSSIYEGLPVVSFSLGDAANFLYGVRKDKESVKKVLLESGDVLIFGGESRLIFHGVESIVPGSAPKRLLDDTNLKHGRLNLTFRQY